MSRSRIAWLNSWAGFPRVSGDEPTGVATLWEYMQFSPRERG